MNEINVTLDGKDYQIDIQKAKELGVLKEKYTRCKSWEEYYKNYKSKRGYYFNVEYNRLKEIACPTATCDQLTKEEAIAISAFSKLLKLRRDWIGDWEPDWNDCKIKYCVTFVANTLRIGYYEACNYSFSFPTEKMAEEFLKCFKDLFTQCKNLI